MITRWSTAYESAPGVEATVQDVVREWFEQLLVETVIGVQSLRGNPEWTSPCSRRPGGEEVNRPGIGDCSFL